MTTFAEAFKSERRRLKLTQPEMTALLPPLPVCTLRAWEIGRRTPPAWTQPLILAHLRRVKASNLNTTNPDCKP